MWSATFKIGHLILKSLKLSRRVHYWEGYECISGVGAISQGTLWKPEGMSFVLKFG